MKKALEALNALVLLGMFVITTLSVIFRVILKIPASWTEELAQYTLIFLAFIGAATVMRDEGHIAITVLVDRLGHGPRKVFKIISKMLMLLFMTMFVLGAFDNTRMNWSVELPTVPWMRIGYMYLVVFLSGLTMTFYILLNLGHDLLDKKTAGTEPGGLH
ncbi:MAG: TRAP transporter small permease [Thermodesulfobacteriota bacterium]